MFDLTEGFSVPTQSNGKVEFADFKKLVSSTKIRIRKDNNFEFRFLCSVIANKKGESQTKYNFLINKNYLKTNTEETFWTVGTKIIGEEKRAFLVQCLDGKMNIPMKIWKGLKCSNQVTSEAIHKILMDCGFLNNDDVACDFSLEAIDTNWTNCNVFMLSIDNEEASVEITDEIINQPVEELV